MSAEASSFSRRKLHRRSSKCRYLHLQVACLSQVFSGSSGRFADNKRTLVNERTASHAPAAVMISAPRYFSLGFPSTTPIVLLPERGHVARCTVLQGIRTIPQVGPDI